MAAADDDASEELAVKLRFFRTDWLRQCLICMRIAQSLVPMRHWLALTNSTDDGLHSALKARRMPDTGSKRLASSKSGARSAPPLTHPQAVMAGVLTQMSPAKSSCWQNCDRNSATTVTTLEVPSLRSCELR